jgi:hypothetical protein
MTRVRVGLELNYEGRALAWAIDYPGCFAYGDEGPHAIIALAPALVRYQSWVNQHAGKRLLELGDFDLRLVDTWTVYSMDDNYEETPEGYAVNAWFKSDWKPLTEGEIEHALDLLRWSRADLLALAACLSPLQLDEKHEGERWTMRGILRHVANAEWWYLDRFDLTGSERASLPVDVLERLAAVRTHLEDVLPGLAGKTLVLGKDGEFWSPRKLIRRVLGHEIDHFQHIFRLANG